MKSHKSSWPFRKYVEATLVGSLLFMSVSQARAQLEIILTNDDGFGEPGIEALKDALRGAGHYVTVGAPDGDLSGSSASVDGPRPFVQVICEQPDECKVRSVCVEPITDPAGCKNLDKLGGATPVASSSATITAVGKDPGDFDLLISGINDGTNTGPQTQFSGTVGAVIGAIAKNGGNIPAIAVSLEPGENATVEEVAEFVVKLVGVLEDHRRGGRKLLPDGVGLKIEYPDRAPYDLSGVKLTVQGRIDPVPGNPGQMFATRYVPFPPFEEFNVFFPDSDVRVPMDGKEVRRADTTALANGFIAITPLEANYTASRRAQLYVGWALRSILCKGRQCEDPWDYHIGDNDDED